MAKRRKKSAKNDSLIWTGVALFAFVCFMILSGCDYTPEKHEPDTYEYKRRQQLVEEITCHWSEAQVAEGACWCVYRYGGSATLVPDRFCKKEKSN